jgi:hypothetical protein
MGQTLAAMGTSSAMCVGSFSTAGTRYAQSRWVEDAPTNILIFLHRVLSAAHTTCLFRCDTFRISCSATSKRPGTRFFGMARQSVERARRARRKRDNIFFREPDSGFLAYRNKITPPPEFHDLTPLGFADWH